MDCSLPGSPVHGILQARILEWVAISFSRGSSQPRDWTQVSCIAGRCFNLWATREAQTWWEGTQKLNAFASRSENIWNLMIKPINIICWSLLLFWIWELFGPTVSLVADPCGQVDPGSTGRSTWEHWWWPSSAKMEKNELPGRGVEGKTKLLWMYSLLGSTLTVPFVRCVPLGKLVSLSLSLLICKMQIITKAKLNGWLQGWDETTCTRSLMHDSWAESGLGCLLFSH